MGLGDILDPNCNTTLKVKEAKEGHAVPCLSSQTVSKLSFLHLFSTIFFTFPWALLVISVFNMVPEHSSKVLWRVLKQKKVLMCLMEKR